MSDLVSETLLEMHFHQPIVKHFQTSLGATFLRLLKPSTQQEVWVGFDQGWVYTSLSTSELLNELRQAVQSKKDKIDCFYLGYFLQFKTVYKVKRKSKNLPAGYTTPYFRSELSLQPNDNTRLSQHETLLRCNNISNTYVCYACPMVFSMEDIYKEPNLDALRCVDITTSPTGWATNEKHFITFKDETDSSPLWCSDPVVGKALSFRQWASIQPELQPEQVLSLIDNTITQTSTHRRDVNQGKLLDVPTEITNSLPESLTLIEFKRNNET